MTERLADIATKIRGVRQLGAIVVAMRGMAASRAQQGRGLLDGIDAYADVVAGAIGQALTLASASELLRPREPADARSLILFAAEQGFAGSYNERIFAAASAMSGTAANYVVGTRGVLYAAERGIPVTWSESMVTQPSAIPRLANRISEVIYAGLAAGTVSAGPPDGRSP